MIRSVGAIVVAIVLSGCAMNAPQYSARMDNVIKLKDAEFRDAKVADFSSLPAKDNANPISLRADRLESPYGNSYSAYLTEAIKQELTLAGKYSQASNVEISGELQKNELNAGSFTTGDGLIAARVVVRKGGQVAYDQVKSATITWPSSFVGAVAIPAAAQSYPKLVQTLLDTLFSDKAFLDALK